MKISNFLLLLLLYIFLLKYISFRLRYDSTRKDSAMNYSVGRETCQLERQVKEKKIQI